MPANTSSRVIKRIIDIIGAIIGLLIFFLILPVIALIIKIDSPGPVFFFQSRVGQYGSKFRFIKFRTMVVDAHLKQSELNMFNETQGITFKMKCDPRVTRVGRILRKTSIDEIPQFWADYGAYDWVAFARCFGRLIDLPKQFPMYVNDFQTLLRFCGNAEVPSNAACGNIMVHNALEDAKELKNKFDYINKTYTIMYSSYPDETMTKVEL